VILARVISFFSVISITVAYLNQFMQLRNVSSSASAILPAMQGLLAGIRILIWYKSPQLQVLYNNLSHCFVYRGPDVRERFSAEVLHSRDSLSEVEHAVLEHHFKQDGENRYMKGNPWEQGFGEKDLLPTPIPVWVSDMLNQFKLSTCTISPAMVAEGQFAEVILCTLRDGVKAWTLPWDSFTHWLRSRSVKTFVHGVLVQNRGMGISLLLHLQQCFISPECLFPEGKEKGACSGWCLATEHGEPVLVDFYAADEEPAKIVVSIRGLDTHH
jgi:hypothetical protein